MAELSTIPLIRAVEPHERRIAEIIVSSWSRYISLLATLGPVVSARTRASMIRDFNVFQIAHWVASEDSLRVVNTRGRVIVVDDARGVTLQFKKLDNRMRVSSADTIQGRLIENQLPLPISDLPPEPVYLHAGYQLDLTGTSIKTIAITYQRGRQVLWLRELPIPAADNIDSFPVRTTERPAQPQVRIRRRRSTEDTDANQRTG